MMKTIMALFFFFLYISLINAFLQDNWPLLAVHDIKSDINLFTMEDIQSNCFIKVVFGVPAIYWLKSKIQIMLSYLYTKLC